MLVTLCLQLFEKSNTLHRSSHQRCSMKKGVVKSFAKFTGKHLCQSPIFSKVAGGACSFIKKRLCHRCFPVSFAKFPRTPFLQNTSGRLLSIVGCFSKNRTPVKNSFHFMKTELETRDTLKRLNSHLL